MAQPRHIALIAGLGNPGGQYEATRHNAGFWFVDQIARRAGATLRHENKFHGHAAKVTLHGFDVWLLKPKTFMNLSGQSVAALSKFYKIEPPNILVVHDEIDLPPGTVRLKRGGGHGGNNGLRDIIAKLGKDFARLRIGVGRPAHSSEVTNYVLHRPSVDDHISIERAMDEGEGVLSLMLEDGLEKATNKLHSKGGEPSTKPKKKRVAKPKPVADEEPKTCDAPAPDVQDTAATPPESPDAPTISLRDQLAGFFRRND